MAPMCLNPAAQAQLPCFWLEYILGASESQGEVVKAPVLGILFQNIQIQGIMWIINFDIATYDRLTF